MRRELARQNSYTFVLELRQDGDKRVIGIAQMLQHPIVDEIKGETLFNIPAHHASGQGVIQQLLPLPGQVFHYQSFGIVLFAPLAAAGLGKPQGVQPPGRLPPDQSKESPQPPAVLGVLEDHSHGQITDVRGDLLLLIERKLHREGFGDLLDVPDQVFSHLLWAVGKFVFPGAHKTELIA